jgi:hypothetical protein
MKKRSTKTNREPSKASLREIPEVTLETHRVLGRGRHAALAESSFEALCIDKRVAKILGGPDAIRRILETLAASIEPPRKNKKRRAA